MRELDHDTLRYEGGAGETVTITVTAQDTVFLVSFNLDGGGTKPLNEGEDITFQLKNQSGAVTRLQINFDFEPNGRYEAVTRSVQDCQLPASPSGGCLHRCLGPDEGTQNYKFFVK